jgi:hypothetical protein
MPGSRIRASTFLAVNRATRSGAKPSKASRNASRFLRMVIQDNPA